MRFFHVFDTRCLHVRFLCFFVLFACLFWKRFLFCVCSWYLSFFCVCFLSYLFNHFFIAFLSRFQPGPAFPFLAIHPCPILYYLVHFFTLHFFPVHHTSPLSKPAPFRYHFAASEGVFFQRPPYRNYGSAAAAGGGCTHTTR